MLAVAALIAAGCGPAATGATPTAGLVPADAAPAASGPLDTWYRDADGDGHGDRETPLAAFDLPGGYAASPDDCNDNDPSMHPGAVEHVSDGVDNDCDGRVDEADDYTPAPGF